MGTSALIIVSLPQPRLPGPVIELEQRLAELQVLIDPEAVDHAGATRSLQLFGATAARAM
jgi:hypothetical protein